MVILPLLTSSGCLLFPLPPPSSSSSLPSLLLLLPPHILPIRVGFESPYLQLPDLPPSHFHTLHRSKGIYPHCRWKPARSSRLPHRVLIKVYLLPQDAHKQDPETKPAAMLADPIFLEKIEKLFVFNIGEYISLPQLVSWAINPAEKAPSWRASRS